MRLSTDELKSKAEKMQRFLEQQPGSEPNDLIKRTEDLNTLIAQSGKMLADAEWYRDEVINSAIMKAIKDAMEEKLSASVLNQFIKTAARDSQYLVKLIDRINATAVHQLDSIRTVISYRKAEMIL